MLVVLLCCLASVVNSERPILPEGTIQGCLSLSQSDAYLDDINKAFPEHTKRMSLGNSFEGRPIVALCVGRCNSNVDVAEAFFNAMHHSREPMSLMALVHTVDYILQHVELKSLWALSLLETRRLWFVPVINPDGYYYNEVHHPNGHGMQRKNRQPSACTRDRDVGVDLNRNYPACFYNNDFDAASGEPCAEDYRGPMPFSEPETIAVKQFIEQSNFTVALNIHSYGRLMLVPFSCQKLGYPKDVDNEYYIKYANALANLYTSDRFTVGRPYEKAMNLYAVDGDAADWMYQEHGIFALSPEVGGGGFWAAESRVNDYADENIPMIVRSSWSAGALLSVSGLKFEMETLMLQLDVENQGLWDSLGNVVVSVYSLDRDSKQMVNRNVSIGLISSKYGRSSTNIKLQSGFNISIVIQDSIHCVVYQPTTSFVNTMTLDATAIQAQLQESRVPIADCGGIFSSEKIPASLNSNLNSLSEILRSHYLESTLAVFFTFIVIAACCLKCGRNRNNYDILESPDEESQ